MLRIKIKFIYILSLLIMTSSLFLFNNCSISKNAAIQLDSSSETAGSIGSAGGSGATGTLCEQDIKNLFAKDWHPFLKTNCTVCHSNGPGKGRFANDDLNLAFEEFNQIGYLKVSDNAINPNHNQPYTGIQHTQKVNEMRIEWLQGLQENATCTGDTSVLPQETQFEKITLETITKTIGELKDNEEKIYTWTINTEINIVKGNAGAPNVPNGRFSIAIRKNKNSGGTSYYTFTSPRLFSATRDAQVTGLFIKLNGFLLKVPTTYNFVDKSIRMGSTENTISSLISTGTIVAPKTLLATDTVSVSFINIQAVDLPPAPPPTSVEIDGPQIINISSTQNYFDIPLKLNRSASEVTIATLNSRSDNCGIKKDTDIKTLSGTCLPEVYNFVCPAKNCSAAVLQFQGAVNEVGATYRRYDWNYKLPSSSVSFKLNETTSSLRVYFSQDERYETNRILSLDIASTVGSAVIGTKKTIHFVIRKMNNPVPNQAVLTFSQLMDPDSGVLGQNCVMCHNSKDNAGGYDMTDYELMRKENVVIPFDQNSKMYLRTQPLPEYLSKPMPANGFLPQYQVIEIRNWILSGAKNN
jgi:hypothetical protein